MSKQRSSLALATLILLTAACSPPPPVPPQPDKIVRTRLAGDGEAAAVRRYSGEVRGRYETVLAFRVPGKLMQRMVDSGAAVKSGQPLARLDATDAVLQSAQAEVQRGLAEAELMRYRELRAKNFISQSALDAREAAYKSAAAQAGLARNQSGYMTLNADRPGVVAAVLAETGQVLAAGQPVFRLVPDGDREIAISIPETDMANRKVGDLAQITFWAGEGKPLAGRLREIAAAADPATRTYAARVTLETTDTRLPVGQTAAVAFVTKAINEGLTVPLSAVFQKDGKPALWVVAADSTVRLRPVVVQRYSDSGAVLGAGIASGERYVEAGVHKLVAGEKVRLAAPAAAEK